MPTAYKQGEHICALYDTPEEQLRTAVDYLADGLRRGERCLYAGDSPAALQRFREALGALGLDAATLETRGALLLRTHADVHLIGGCFDCERMLGMLNETLEAALRDGFTGLRTCGDMSWLLVDAPGTEQAVEYEALVNQLFHGVPASGMCQYDRRRMSAQIIDAALATHPSIFVDGVAAPNPSYRSSALAGLSAPPAPVDRAPRQR